MTHFGNKVAAVRAALFSRGFTQCSVCGDASLRARPTSEAVEHVYSCLANAHVCTACGGPSGSTGYYDHEGPGDNGRWTETCEDCLDRLRRETP